MSSVNSVTEPTMAEFEEWCRLQDIDPDGSSNPEIARLVIEWIFAREGKAH